MSNAYLQMDVRTASPEALIARLFDRAIRCTRDAQTLDPRDQVQERMQLLGRSLEIVSELRKSVASALGCSAAEVGVVTVDIPSKWNMEGGSLLPEPGEEAAWLERHRS